MSKPIDDLLETAIRDHGAEVAMLVLNAWLAGRADALTNVSGSMAKAIAVTRQRLVGDDPLIVDAVNQMLDVLGNLATDIGVVAFDVAQIRD